MPEKNVAKKWGREEITLAFGIGMMSFKHFFLAQHLHVFPHLIFLHKNEAKKFFPFDNPDALRDRRLGIRCRRVFLSSTKGISFSSSPPRPLPFNLDTFPLSRNKGRRECPPSIRKEEEEKEST